MFALGGYMITANNINAQGQIVPSDAPQKLSRAVLKQLVFDSLNANEYQFVWDKRSEGTQPSQPYSGIFFDGNEQIHLYIYIWNITRTRIGQDINDKRIQIQADVNNVGFERPISSNEKTLLLGVYNCPQKPIIAAWDSWYYQNHGTNSCYIDVRELKKALDNSVSTCERGCKVYSMTSEYLPVYVSHLKSENITDLETPKGKASSVRFKNERSNKKKRYIATTERIKEKIKELSEREKEAIIKQRIGQGYFRDLLLQKYGCKCALCSITTLYMLRASHIKSWKASTNDQKLDENNGLLLCAHHDALFDKYLLSFEDDGNPIISSLIPQEQYESLGINAIPHINVLEEMKPYLRWHRQELKKREQKNNG